MIRVLEPRAGGDSHTIGVNSLYRRRSRISSTTVGLESRWKPSVALLVLVVGILVGLVVNLPAALNARSATLDDAYLVLSATLFRQGESVDALRDRMRDTGFVDPPTAVSHLATRYSESRDSTLQSQATLLQSFSQAMDRAPSVQAPVVGQESVSPATSVQAPAAQDAQEVASNEPIVIGTPIVARNATPLTSVIITPERLIPESGTVLTAARLRSQPTTNSEQLGVLPEGATVSIKNILEGEAVEAVEPRWYHVTYEDLEGYVYYTLISANE